jgi:uncharacterized repeat protein (TIGR01451 family)
MSLKTSLLLILLFVTVGHYAQLSWNAFTEPTHISWSTDKPVDIKYTDVNDDGDDDIIVALSRTGRVALYYNEGQGQYSDQVVLANAPTVEALEWGDVDGDGLEDLIFMQELPGRIGWIKRTQNGFEESEQFDLESWSALDIAVADISGDGLADFVLAAKPSSFTFSLFYYEQISPGIFGETPLTMLGVPHALEFHDVDLDGDIDLLQSSSDALVYYSNTGAGGFGGPIYIHEYAQNDNSEHRFALIDVDADGLVDVLDYSSSGSELMFFKALAGGGFDSALMIETNLDGLSDVSMSDLDADGLQDLMLASWSAEEFVWKKNQGNMTFSANNAISDSLKFVLSSCHDLNGDGFDDAITGAFNADQFGWHENDGAGNFSSLNPFSPSTTDIQQILTLDKDLDGDDDLFVLSRADGKLSTYEYTQNDGFGEQEILLEDLGYVIDLVSADVDGDGYEDLLLLDLDLIGVRIFLFDDITHSYAETSSPLLTPYTINFQLTDMNQDELVDFVMADGEGDIWYYPNLGNGQFDGAQLLIENIGYLFSFEVSDMNLDELPDILVYADTTACYLNQGNNSFSASNYFPETFGGGYKTISSQFLNGDTLPDVLITDESETSLAYHLGLGDGQFSDEIVLWSDGFNIATPAVGDLDGDGDQDILLRTINPLRLILFDNINNESFSQHILLEGPDFLTEGIIMSDMDQDGVDDILLYEDAEVFWIENLGGKGCTDPSACNFDPDSWIDDGSCCFSNCGCTVEGAENYDANALCDDGSCGFIVQGTVFYDENEDGIMNNGEYGLAMQQLGFFPDSLSLITNDNGIFFINASGYDEFLLILADNELFPYFTTPSALYFDATEDNWNSELFFGISNELPEFELCIDLYPIGQGYPCDVLSNHNICFRNMGNVPVDGVVELEYDMLFQGHTQQTPIDSAAGNTVWLSYSNLLPGQMFFYDVNLHTPTVDHIGEFLSSSARIWGFYQGDTVAYGEESIHIELTCAYDPNDKQVFPNGYSEMHYIDNDTVLEFLVRFQNTGNAPATDVRIRDTLDMNLDLSTFELVANSHSLFTTVDAATREVDFYFQDIQLPDSVNNEPESHGLVSFKIRPTENLPLLTELTNTASIFFDNNPPIVTNTTWSTIYDCSLFEVSFTDDGALLTASEGDYYQWFLNGDLITGATEQEHLALVNGSYAVQVDSDFPCSNMSPSTFVIVDGVDDLSQPAISLFPNPMSEQAIITVAQLKGLATLKIVDLTGKVVRSEQININQGRFMFNRNGLAAGQYILQIGNTDQNTRLKFVVE